VPNLASILPTITTPHFSRSRYIIPWLQLTRYSMPKFQVSRRRLFYGGEYLEPGTPIPESMVMHRTRVRQLYEQWLIEPIAGTVVSRPVAPVGFDVQKSGYSVEVAEAAKAKPLPTIPPAVVDIPATNAEFYVPDIALPIEEVVDTPEASLPLPAAPTTATTNLSNFFPKPKSKSKKRSK